METVHTKKKTRKGRCPLRCMSFSFKFQKIFAVKGIGNSRCTVRDAGGSAASGAASGVTSGERGAASCCLRAQLGVRPSHVAAVVSRLQTSK